MGRNGRKCSVHDCGVSEDYRETLFDQENVDNVKKNIFFLEFQLVFYILKID